MYLFLKKSLIPNWESEIPICGGDGELKMIPDEGLSVDSGIGSTSDQMPISILLCDWLLNWDCSLSLL